MPKKENTNKFIHLILDNGATITITVEGDNFEDVFDGLNEAIEQGKMFDMAVYEGAYANMGGIGMDKINTRRVVGLD